MQLPWRKKKPKSGKYWSIPRPIWKFLLFNFIGGVFRGFGYFIGFTVVVGLIIWILSWFPFFDELMAWIGELQNSAGSYVE